MLGELQPQCEGVGVLRPTWEEAAEMATSNHRSRGASNSLLSVYLSKEVKYKAEAVV